MDRENTSQQRMAADLRELAASDQLRSLEIPTGIHLCSNDYLALSANPILRQAVMVAVASADRVGSTGSRLLSGHAREWENLEEEFANFIGTEAALFFTSGYAANVGVLSSVLQRDDIVFSDELNHASLIDGIRLSAAERVVYPHCDLTSLEAALHLHKPSAAQKIIVTESVFSMDGDFAPLAELHALAQKYGAELIVDEAHAIGVFGPQGRGRAAELGIEREILAAIAPCGKALASSGAFVCGSSVLKQFLINRARTFIFSTALPPYMAGQIHAALNLARAADSERAHLIKISAALRESIQSSGFDTSLSESQIIPIILGENSRALEFAAALQQNGFATRAIRPPTVPDGSSRLRISLTCAISDEDLAKLVRALPSPHDHQQGRASAASAAQP